MKRWIRWLKWPALGLTVVILGLTVLVAVVYLTADPGDGVPATVADDPSLPHVTLDGVTFHAETFGDPAAPVVIVLHGGPGGDYRNLLPLQALSDEYFVVFYDQRGTGLSPRVPAEELTLDSTLEDLHRLVLHYGQGEKVRLIGHSWGGIVVAGYLSRHPELVERAVMAEPGVLTDEEITEFAAAMQPKMDPQLMWYGVKTMFASMKLDGPDDDAGKDFFMLRMMTAPGENPLNAYWCDGAPPPAAHEEWRIGTTAMQTIFAKAEQPDGSYAIDVLDGIDGYTDEVLLIASECNTLIGVERQQAHVAMFPSARLEVIEDSGHLMFAEQTEASLVVLREYLSARDPVDGVALQ